MLEIQQDVLMKTQIQIIAEAGVNHNGDIALARKLIDVATQAGADYVKFQTFRAETLASKTAKQSPYQTIGTMRQQSQIDMLKPLELDWNAYRQLLRYSEGKRIKFLSTPFDSDSIDFLFDLGVDFFKIPSGEVTDKPYLERIASKGLPIVMSTGMASLQEIEEALEVLLNGGLTRDEVTILHCNTDYPTALTDVNLNAMLTIRDAFRVKVGYSDHTMGISVPIAAVAMGAVVIEKHFTLSRAMEGPDHQASLEPEELNMMVARIREIEKALGDGIKRPTGSEIKNIPIVRRSIHLSRDLSKGEVLAKNDLIMLRPGDGISPMSYQDVLGKALLLDLPKYHKLAQSDFG